MQLQLKNIGMIKEANVKIDGLTVIAGENDTGKSTLSKALYLIINSMDIEKTNTSDIINLGRRNDYGKTIKENIFSKQSFTSNSLIQLLYDNKTFVYKDGVIEETIYKKDIKIASTLFIETPLVWNLQYLFRTSSDIESHLKMLGKNIKIPYPFLMKNLYFELVTQNNFLEDWTDEHKNDITSIINGEFKKDEDGIFRFYREDKKFDLIDIATGIKYFGILQVLLNNNHLNSYSLLILDEPEVHLHPKWQLEMAKTIVELVKNGVKIVVNSHSPYMIEALKVYSENKGLKDKTNFYLAEKNEDTISSSIKDVTTDLEPIFIKLAEPYRKLELELE